MNARNELPHDYLAEKSLLGSLIIDGRSFNEVSDLRLQKEDFYNPQNGFVFQAIYELASHDQPIDYVSVCGKLADMGKLDSVGGQDSILELVEEQGSAANITHYAKVVKDKSVIRELIRTAHKVVEKGTQFSGNIHDYINEVESSFFKLTSQTKKGGLQDLKSFLKVNLLELKSPARKPGEISGIPTGFPALDRKMLGMQPGQLIVLAARPGMGKTALALNIAVNACERTSLPVAIFSLEMLGEELSMRVIASQASVDSTRLRSKDYHDTDLRKISHAVQKLSQIPFYINDAADLSLMDIKSQCRKIKMEQGLGLIAIDYIQLMQSHSNNPSREQQISEISRGLKNLAKEMGCPVLAMSQLNRAVESRTDKRPMVSDLRESGSIEQDADIVMLIYRDEVYNKENSQKKGIAEIIIGKNRAGEVGTVELAWIGSQTKFAGLAPEKPVSPQQHQ